MKEEKIKITRLKCIADNTDKKMLEEYYTDGLTINKDYVMINFVDDNEGTIQFMILNDEGKPHYYDSKLFVVML